MDMGCVPASLVLLFFHIGQTKVRMGRNALWNGYFSCHCFTLFYLCCIFHAMGTNREVLLCAHIEQQSLEREFR